MAMPNPKRKALAAAGPHDCTRLYLAYKACVEKLKHMSARTHYAPKHNSTRNSSQHGSQYRSTVLDRQYVCTSLGVTSDHQSSMRISLCLAANTSLVISPASLRSASSCSRMRLISMASVLPPPRKLDARLLNEEARLLDTEPGRDPDWLDLWLFGDSI